MNTKVILTQGKYTLLESETQYIVAYNYDEKTNTWEYGAYFTFFEEIERKLICLSRAIDIIRYKTEQHYFTRPRLEEIASKAIDNITEEMENFIADADIDEDEAEYFCIKDQWKEVNIWE